jgi:hypothetical protein
MHKEIASMKTLCTVPALCAGLVLAAACGFGLVARADDKSAEPLNTPPEGFTALFNGKDLTGWQSVITMKERKTLSEEKLKEKLESDNKNKLKHWTVTDGILHYDGKGDSLQTVKDYGDFELLCDWKIALNGDSGIYLRGQPQVQIWDSDNTPGARGLDKGSGSGGLWNNPEDKGKRPLKKADKPVGEWNHFRIIVKVDKVTVYLNGTLVVDKQPLLNYWFRGEAVPKTGPIELQHHGDPLWFRNIYIKELKN